MSNNETSITTEVHAGVIVSQENTPSINSLPVDAPGRKFLSVLPESYHADLMELEEPTIEELKTAVVNLDERSRKGFYSWVQKTSGRKTGYHVDQTEFKIPDLRIDQGSGNDLAKPENSKKGFTYDSNGNLVTAHGQHATLLGLPERINCAVLAIHDARLLWPPKDENGNAIPLAGLKDDAPKNAPLCSSLDRKMGFRFGDCKKCSYQPFSQGKGRKNECKNEIHIYVVRMDDEKSSILPFSEIYKITMTGSSVSTAAEPIKKKVNSWPALWHRLFSLETISQSKDNKTWIQWKSAIAIGPGQPTGIPTSNEAKVILNLLAKKIDAAIFYPSLANCYTQANKKTNPLEITGPENTADGAQLNASVDELDPAANL